MPLLRRNLAYAMIKYSQSVAVIEDDPIISWHLNHDLTAIGCNVIAHYEDFAEAEHHAKNLFPDIIISNLKLSDGWVDDRYLNTLQGFSMHVIILTGLRDTSLFEPGWDRPSFHFLFKPYSKNQLEECLNVIQETIQSPQYG